MKTNRNEVERFGLPVEELDALFASSSAQAISDSEARLRAAMWPREVEGVLISLAREQAALRSRVEALETHMGIAQD
jgi:hypothetical protein